MQEQQQARIEDAAAMEADELDEASNSVVHLSLDNVYQTHGDLAQAAAMYKKSIALFQEVRAIPQVQQLQELLDKLTVARATSSAGK